MCGVSRSSLSQMIKANFADESRHDTNVREVWACVRRRASLITHEFKSACQSTVSIDIETEGDAFIRIVEDGLAACRESVRLQASN